MKLFIICFALVVGLIGISNAELCAIVCGVSTICATDLKSGGLPQNFADIAAMHAENARGGGKHFANIEIEMPPRNGHQKMSKLVKTE